MPAAVQATGGATARAHLQLTIKAPSWVEVTDAEGKLRLQKLVPAGEVLDFDDAPSYSVVVGNAAGVQAVVNGQALNLSERARNNVARFVAR
jgi:cytoskeleton protein RodZ